MAYTKQTWNDLPNTTTPVTAERLNHMEDGIYATDTIANTLNDDKTDMKTITFNNEWMYAHKIGGADIMVQIPVYNPDNLAPTLTLTSSELYIGSSGWVTLTKSGTGVQGYNKSFVMIRFSTPSGVTTTNGDTYLIRMVGTLKIGS